MIRRRKDRSPTARELGRRAQSLRRSMKLSPRAAAVRADVDPDEMTRFERTGEGSVALLLALVRALSSGSDLEHLLTTPRFGSLDEAEAFERRRRASL